MYIGRKQTGLIIIAAVMPLAQQIPPAIDFSGCGDGFAGHGEGMIIRKTGQGLSRPYFYRTI